MKRGTFTIFKIPGSCFFKGALRQIHSKKSTKDYGVKEVGLHSRSLVTNTEVLKEECIIWHQSSHFHRLSDCSETWPVLGQGRFPLSPNLMGETTFPLKIIICPQTYMS